MKLKVQKLNHDKAFEIEIPSHINPNQCQVGEEFLIYIFENNIKKEMPACFIADKKSLLIGQDVVRLTAFKNNCEYQANILRPVEPKKSATPKGFGSVKSPMSGKVLSIGVKENGEVQVGDLLVVIEAMKMENQILAQVHGFAQNIKAIIGQNVVSGEELLVITEKSL